MSDKKPRDTDKIRFFELGTEGEIRPAFPPEEDPGDPTFAVSESAERVSDNWVAGTRVGGTSSLILDELDILKPQLDGIKRANKPLTEDEAEILKKYITLRESEVDELRLNLAQYQNHVQKSSQELHLIQEKNRELERECQSRRRGEDHAQSELIRAKADHEERVASLKNDYEDRIRAYGTLEKDLLELERKKDEWKQKIAEDLRRIRLKERELETKHELLKRDSQALLDSKDRHLLEVKSKSDALELEMESMEEKLRTSYTALSNVEVRKKRLLETLKLSITLIEGINKVESK